MQASRRPSWWRGRARASTHGDPGFGTRFGSEDINAIPTRRASMFDFIRAAPGVSPTSPSSGIATTVSAFGSGTNENQFLIDGMNTTCPCSGVARTEPGVDFIHEVQVSAVGASAEFGNMQGAVINVVTKQGGERFLYDGSYYGQPSALTSQPVSLRYLGSGEQQSGYERAKYEDFTNNLAGPAIRDRLWFFAGYQWLRDYDSQPGTDPSLPRMYQMQKALREAHLAARPGIADGAKLSQRDRHRPRATDHRHPIRSDGADAHLDADDELRRSHAHDVGQHPVGCSRRPVRLPSKRRPERSESDNAKPVRPCHRRHHRRAAERRGRRPLPDDRQSDPHALPARLEAEHQLKVGGQFERGEHHAINFIPTNVRYRGQGRAAAAVHLEPSRPTSAVCP